MLLTAGALAAVAGFVHFRRADRAIREGEPLPTGGTLILVMTSAVLLAAAAGVVSVLVGG